MGALFVKTHTSGSLEVERVTMKAKTHRRKYERRIVINITSFFFSAGVLGSIMIA